MIYEEERVLAEKIASFYEDKTDELETPQVEDILNEFDIDKLNAYEGYIGDIEDYVWSHEGELSDEEINTAGEIVAELRSEYEKRVNEAEQVADNSHSENTSYSHEEILRALYEYEMVNDVPEAERYTHIAFASPNERVLSPKMAMSEAELNGHFEEAFNHNQIEDVRQKYAERQDEYTRKQNIDNLKGLMGIVEADASYEWSRSRSPWGHWGAVFSNPENPQNYIEYGITGYETTNTAIIEARLFENGNQLVDSRQSKEINVADIRNLEDLSNGFTTILDNEFKDSVVELARGVMNDYDTDLAYETYNEHNERLREAGFNIDEIDTSRYEERKANEMDYTPMPNRYYEPQFEIDGTAEELFVQARNGYIENPDALHRISEILTLENMTEEAERVGYMEEREREDGNNLYSVAQMKLDMLDGHGGIDDVAIADGVNLTVMYEPNNDTVAWQVSQIAEEGNEEVYSEASNSISFDEFKAMSQQDFERIVNETMYYNMNEIERTPIERKKELIPIEEVENGGRVVSGRYGDREAVYNAVLAYENANAVENPVIDENGQYEDKDFLFNAYDKYVAISNNEELAPYADKITHVNDTELAQIHYGLANGLDEDRINLLIECANMGDYRANEMQSMRRLLESGETLENAMEMLNKDSFTVEAYNSCRNNKSDEQKSVLRQGEEQGIIYNADYLYSLASQGGDADRYNAQVKEMVNTLNSMKNEKFDDTTLDVVGQQIISAVSDPNISMTEEEIKSIGRRMVNTHTTPSTYEALTEAIKKGRGQTTEKAVENSHSEENSNSNSVGVGTMPNHDAEEKRRALLAEVKEGVHNIMTEDKFKAYLDTRSHLFYKNFSVNNAMMIFMHKPSATYVMGYDQWQKVGRTPKPKTGIPIFVPMFYYEKYSGGLYKSIVANLSAQLAKNPNQTAVYRVGKTGMELTMINNTNQMGVKVNGKEVGFLDTPKKQREFIDSNILNKMVAGFNVNYVFDVSDTIVPEKLWVRESEAKKSELVLDKNGEPIKGTRAYKGKVQIYNTPERQAGFQPSLDLSVVEKDPDKMRTLFDTIKSISERHGVPVTVVDRESDETLKGGADGYFHRVSPDIADKYPRGYIIMPSDVLANEPTKAVANLIHEIAHSDLHGNMEKLQERMGEDKITRDMKEVQAEATAYLTAKQYGLDTATSSFSYLAVWSKGFDMQTFEKSLDVINTEATKLVSEINAELAVRDLTHDLQDKPKEALNEEQIKPIASNYVQRALEAQNTIDTQIATIPNLIKENANNADMLDIINQQNKNLTLQKAEVETQLSLVEALTQSTDRAEQDAIIEQIDSSFERSDNLRLNFSEKVEQFSKVAQRDKVGLKEQFIANPLKTINSMAKQYEALGQLSDVQKNYIAKSAYIRDNIAPMLNDNPQKFIDEATKRAGDISKIMAKNGSFVEVNHCEEWENGKVFRGGELMHPKVADKIVKEAEKQIEQLKTNAEKKGEYVPYMKCDMTVFTITEKAKNLTAYPCKIDLGDFAQKGLADFLHQTANNKTEMVQHFDKALNEKNAKEKIIAVSEEQKENEVSHSEKGEAEVTQAEGASIGEWQKDINSEKGANTNSNDNKDKSNERDGKSGKNEQSR